MSDAFAFIAGCCAGVIGWMGLLTLVVLFFQGANASRNPDDLSDEIEDTNA